MSVVNTSKQKILAVGSGILTVLLLLFVGFFVAENDKTRNSANDNAKTKSIETVNSLEDETVDSGQHILPPDKFTDLNLVAKSVYVFKPETGEILYLKNSGAQLPLASIAKVMNAIVVGEYMHPDAVVEIPSRALDKFGSSGLISKEKWQIGDLANFTMMVSSNDGANALAAATAAFMKGTKNENLKEYTENVKDFKTVMNNKAKALGLTQTYFLDEAGLDLTDDISGAYGSARDVAYMFDYAIKNASKTMESTTVKDAWFTSLDNINHPAINTDEVINEIPGLIAGKTGYTPLAGGNLVVAFNPGMGDRVVAVVLGSTKKGRFDDMKKIVDAVLETPEL